MLRGEMGVAIEPPGLERHFARGAALFHDDPDQAALFPPEIGPCPVRYPPAYACSLTNVELVGYRTLLTRSGGFLNDEPGNAGDAGYLARIAQTDPFPNEETGLVPTGDGFALDRQDRPTHTLDGSVLVLCSTEPANYGSFLFRLLPKLAMFRGVLPDWPVLAHTAYAQYRELLELAGVAPDRILPHDPGHIYRIGHAVAPGLRNPEAYLDELSIQFYAGLRQRFGVPAAGRRIYVSRLGVANPRRMVNEAELETALAAQGFDIVRPHTLSAREQIAAFSAASLVVGPSGAAMFNCVFCHPGTVLVDIESEPYWIHAHGCLFTSCGLRWGVFEGKTLDDDFSVTHKPYRVNIPALLDRLAGLAV